VFKIDSEPWGQCDGAMKGGVVRIEDPVVIKSILSISNTVAPAAADFPAPSLSTAAGNVVGSIAVDHLSHWTQLCLLRHRHGRLDVHAQPHQSITYPWATF
jgi:hypothetical protein